jgi:hypothetical protein
MPPMQTYNPIVIGFVEGKGAVHIHLQAARDAYGQLPSDYGLLPGAEGRRVRKALNLPVGLALMDLLREDEDLPEIMGKFFERWGRDFDADFQVRIDRFQHLSDPWTLRQVVEENREILAGYLDVDVRDYLDTRGLIPRSTLRAIPADRLLPKAREILSKRRRNPAHAAEAEQIAQAVAFLDAKTLLGQIVRVLGEEVSRWAKDRLMNHVDEVARLFRDLSTGWPACGAKTWRSSLRRATPRSSPWARRSGTARPTSCSGRSIETSRTSTGPSSAGSSIETTRS